MNTCFNADSPEQAELLFAYVDGTLAPAEARQVELHAASCEGCRKLIEGQQALWRTLDEFEAPELSADFNRNLHAAVEAEASRSALKRWLALASAWLTPKNLAIPAGALAMLMVGVSFLGQQAAPPEHKAGLELEVKQIESTLDDLDVLTALDLSDEEKL